jgi:hypothetical protein
LRSGNDNGKDSLLETEVRGNLGLWTETFEKRQFWFEFQSKIPDYGLKKAIRGGLTTGPPEADRGLKFEPDAEIGLKVPFC